MNFEEHLNTEVITYTVEIKILLSKTLIITNKRIHGKTRLLPLFLYNNLSLAQLYSVYTSVNPHLFASIAHFRAQRGKKCKQKDYMNVSH